MKNSNDITKIFPGRRTLESQIEEMRAKLETMSARTTMLEAAVSALQTIHNPKITNK